MSIPTCIDTNHPKGQRGHVWRSTGLHVVDDVLCNTRVCDLCGRAEHSAYGSRRSVWKVDQ